MKRQTSWLLVIELGDALGRQRRATQVEFLAFLPELDVDARVLRPRQFLGCATVRRAQAADDVLLVCGIRRTGGGGDAATHVQVAVLAACMNAFGNYSEGLLHKGLCDRPCSNRLLRLSDKALIPKEIKALRVRLEFFGVADGNQNGDLSC